MSNSDEPSPPTPKSILDQLKEWKELIAFSAAVLTSALAGLLGNDKAQAVGWGLAVVFTAIGAWVVRRSWLRRKLKADQEKLRADLEKKPKSTAFRSLAPFEEIDDLPGYDRKQQARTIATRIASDDFRFGIVCGDSGCGKTSLLRSEVIGALGAAGLKVFYLRSPRRLTKSSASEATAGERLAFELKNLRDERLSDGAAVFIVDQFEEWFLEYREPAVRAGIGKFIRDLTERSVPMRVVCAVRREFLVDFHDLAGDLPNPTLPNTTFQIRNFSVAQAVDVINHCATSDGFSLDETFAKTISHDLAEAGEVRPPELQIVCTYLAEVGSLTTAGYQSVGGTSGILSHYIKDALNSSRAPEVAARLLRAMCDFPARAKRKPKTLEELVADVGTASVAPGDRLQALIGELVAHFLAARIITEDTKRSAPVAFVLIHDYLVDAVQLATSDASTQTEEANQLLRYYLLEKRGSIPLQKLTFIRKHADPPLLEEPKARRLIRESLFAPMMYWSGTALAALAIAGGLYLMATSSVQWKSKIIARHWDKGESDLVTYEQLPESGRVIAGTFWGTQHVRLWEAKAGSLLRTIENPHRLTPTISPKGKYVLLSNERGNDNDNDKNPRLIRLSDGMETTLPPGNNYSFSDSEEFILWRTGNDAQSQKAGEPVNIEVYSLTEGRVVHEIKGIPGPETNWSLFYDISSEGDRLVILMRDGKRNVIAIYDVASGQKLAILTHGDDDGSQFAVHTPTVQVCTLSYSPTKEVVVQLWNLRDGTFVRERRIAPKDWVGSWIRFSQDGSHLIVSSFGSSLGPVVLQVSDLQPAKGISAKQMRVASHMSGRDKMMVLYWNSANGVNIWEVGSNAPILLPKMELGEKDRLAVSSDLRHSVIWREGGLVELFDLAATKRVSALAHTGRLVTAHFTIDDAAVALIEEGGLCSLFEAQNGDALAQRFALDGNSVIGYDPDLRRFQLWNQSGQILRFIEGREYFGNFVPTRSGGEK